MQQLQRLFDEANIYTGCVTGYQQAYKVVGFSAISAIHYSKQVQLVMEPGPRFIITNVGR